MNLRSILKIVVLGPEEAGKTSIRRRMASNVFEERCSRWQGETMKQVNHHGRVLTASLCESLREGNLSSSKQQFYKEADVGLLCFDRTNPSSLEDLHQIFKEVTLYAPQIDVLLVECKCDLPQGISESTISKLEKDNIIVRKTFKTSSKTAEGCPQLFDFIVENYSQLALNRSTQRQRLEFTQRRPRNPCLPI